MKRKHPRKKTRPQSTRMQLTRLKLQYRPYRKKTQPDPLRRLRHAVLQMPLQQISR
jgi:hypothetical protein